MEICGTDINFKHINMELYLWYINKTVNYIEYVIVLSLITSLKSVQNLK